MSYNRSLGRDRETVTGLGLGWFGGGAWGQGGAPEDGGGRKRVRRTWGWGAQGLGEGRVSRLPSPPPWARTQTLAGCRCVEGREPRPSEQEVLDPRPELSMGEK